MNSQAKTIAKNTTLLLFANVFSKAVMFLIAILIARSLSIEEFGFYSYSLTLGGIILLTSDFGINTYALRETSRNFEKRNSFMGSAIKAKAILSTLALLLVAIIIIFSDFSQEESILFIFISIAFILVSFSTLFFYGLRAKQNFSIETGLTTGAHLLLALLIFTVLLSNTGFIGIGIAFVLSFIPLFILSFLFMQKNGFSITFEDLKKSRQTIRKSVFFGAGGFLVLLFLDSDIIIIKHMLGDFPVGIYSVVFRFFLIAMMFSTVFAGAIFPVLSKYAKYKERFFQLVKKSVLISLAVGIMSGIIIFFFGERIILFLYGEKFSSAIGLLVWVVAIIPLSTINSVLINSLAAVGLEKQAFINFFLATLINVSLTIILISGFGLVGVLMATLIGLIVLTTTNVISIMNFQFRR